MRFVCPLWCEKLWCEKQSSENPSSREPARYPGYGSERTASIPHSGDAESRGMMSIMRGCATILRLLDRGLVAGEDVEELMRGLREALGAQGAMVATSWAFSPTPHQVGVPLGWQELYEAEGLVEVDPARFLTKLPCGTWFTDARDTPADFVHTPAWQHFAEFFSDVAVVQVGAPDDDRTTLVVHRERGARPFDEDDWAVMDLLSPHLRAGLGGLTARAALHARPHHSLDEVIRSCAGSATISFPDGTTKWSQKGAELWRRRLDVKSLARVERMVARAALEAASRNTHSARLPHDIRADFVRLEPHRRGERRTLVLFHVANGEPDLPALAPAEELLSPRQRQVARMLARGASLKEIAAALDIREDTARDHRNAVFERLGVTSRGALAALLWH